jgi:hypothetical protein
MLVTTLYQVNREVLKRKGYSDQYVEYLRRSCLRRNVGIAIIVPVLGILAGFLVYAVAGDIKTPQNASYVLLLWLLLVVPFPILDHRKSARESKEIVQATGATVVVDFNYRVLHLVFQPWLEAILSSFYVLYFVLFFGPFHIALIHVALLWALYGTARFGRHLTAPAMRDAYLFLIVFMMINQGLLLFHLSREMLIWYSCCAEAGADTRLIAGSLLGGAMAIKLFVYLFRVPEFSTRLSRSQSASSVKG